MRIAIITSLTLAMLAANSSPLLASDVSEASHMLNGNVVYSPISESSVTVFLYKPNVQFEIVGTIDALGMADGQMFALKGLLDLDLEKGLGISRPGEREDVALAVSALKKEAAGIGANGVIITQQAQISVGNQGSTARRIIGVAIRY